MKFNYSYLSAPRLDPPCRRRINTGVTHTPGHLKQIFIPHELPTWRSEAVLVRVRQCLTPLRGENAAEGRLLDRVHALLLLDG